MLAVGDTAPEIDATTTGGDRFVLSEQAAICTVIYFFPKAFTPGCTREAKNFAMNYPELVLAGARVVGISTDDDETQCEFARSVGAPFPMIADRDRRIGKAYDVLFPLIGIAKRVSYVVDTERRVLAVFHDGFEVEPHRDGVLGFVHAYSDAVRAKAQELWSAELRHPTIAAEPGVAPTVVAPPRSEG